MMVLDENQGVKAFSVHPEGDSNVRTKLATEP